MSLRNLTEDEIEDIISFVKPNKKLPEAVGESIVNHQKRLLREQFKGQKVHPEIIPQLKEKLERQYYKSFVSAGERVGIITAQSIGESQTQSTLNTFHKAGSSENKIDVVSRFSELLSASKNGKLNNALIYLTNPPENVSELREIVGSSLLCLTIKKLTLKSSVCIDKSEELWYKAHTILYGRKVEYTDCISLKINMDILFTYKITLEEIVEVIEGKYDNVTCMFSPSSIGQIDVYFDTSNLELPYNRIAYVSEENKREIFLEEVVLPELENIVVSGVFGVEEMFFNREKGLQGGEWIIEVEMAKSSKNSVYPSILMLPYVDKYRTISTNIWDVYNCLGIEAIREFMIGQFQSIMTGINPKHISLIVDRMTFDGKIVPISRYTMKKSVSALSKASFEETFDNFLIAGVYGQKDNTQGVSASIICGKRAPLGTGLCDIKIDISKLPQ